jgi:hypothetical protein
VSCNRIVIPTGAKRSGGICSAPCGSLKSFLGSDTPAVAEKATIVRVRMSASCFGSAGMEQLLVLQEQQMELKHL